MEKVEGAYIVNFLIHTTWCISVKTTFGVLFRSFVSFLCIFESSIGCINVSNSGNSGDRKGP